MSNAKRYILISSLAVIAIICGYFIFWGGSPPNDGPQKQTSPTITPTPTPSERSDREPPPTLQVRVLWADDHLPAHGTSVTLTYTDDATSPTEGRRTAKATALTDYSGIASFRIPELSRAGKVLIETARAHALPSSATLALPQAGVVDISIAKTYVIYGMVYLIDEANKRLPVEGAEVSAVGVEGAVAYTDANGGFRQVLTSPTVQLLAIAGAQTSSVDPARAPTHRLVHKIDNGPYIMVLGGEGDLLVSVLDKATFEPIAGARVELKVEKKLSPRVYETDAEGICEVVGLSAKMVSVTAVAPGYARKSALVNLEANEPNTAVFALSPAGKIHVHTVDKEKRPFPGVMVAINGNDRKPSRANTIITDEAGYGVFDDVPIGPPFFVQAIPILSKTVEEKTQNVEEKPKTKSRDRVGLRSKSVPVIFKQKAPIVAISLEVTTFTYKVGRGTVSKGDAWLKGRVTDEEDQPVPGLDVTLRFQTGMPPYPPTLTDNNGEFHLSEIHNRNNLALTIKGKGYKPILNKIVEANTTLDLIISKAITIRGNVIDALTSAPITVFTVFEHPRDAKYGEIDNRNTDGITMFSPDGTFSLGDIYSKNTLIEVRADNYAPSFKGMVRRRKNLEYTEDNGLKKYKYETVRDLQFVLKPMKQLKGIVIDKATGDPIPGALVGVKKDIPTGMSSKEARKSKDDPDLYYKFCSHVTVTNDEGEFSFDIYKRYASFLASADGYAPRSLTTGQKKAKTPEEKRRFVIALSKAATLKVIYPESYQDHYKLVSATVSQYSDKDPEKKVAGHFEHKVEGNTVTWDYLSAGRHSVYVALHGVEPITNRRLSLIDSVSIKQHVIIKEGETTIIEPLVSSRLSGRIFLSGKPVVARVFLQTKQGDLPADPNGSTFICAAHSNEEGYYETPLIAPGEYDVDVWVDVDSVHTQFEQPPIQILGDEVVNIELR